MIEYLKDKIIIAYDDNFSSKKVLKDYERSPTNMSYQSIEINGINYKFWPNHFLQKDISTFPKISNRMIDDKQYQKGLKNMAKIVQENEPTTNKVNEILKDKQGRGKGN